MVDENSFAEDRHAVHRPVGPRLRNTRESCQELTLFPPNQDERIGAELLRQGKILELKFRPRLIGEMNLQRHLHRLSGHRDQRRVSRSVRKAAFAPRIRVAGGDLLDLHGKIPNRPLVPALCKIELQGRLLAGKEQLSGSV